MQQPSSKPLGQIGNTPVYRGRDLAGRDRYICEYCRAPFVHRPNQEPHPDAVAQHMKDKHETEAMRQHQN